MRKRLFLKLKTQIGIWTVKEIETRASERLGEWAYFESNRVVYSEGRSGFKNLTNIMNNI